MRQEIEISNEDICYAEKLLLSDGKNFDEERIEFIRNLDTIDLQAVPGSGKTTALLAKLVILERKLPFKDGSGILVLSHTNAAIDEIKMKIQKYCPKLFSYPNFIGTIQSFVDEFLAIPYYVNIYEAKLNCIDNDTYNEQAIKAYNSSLNRKAKFWIERRNDPESFFKNLRFDKSFNLTNGINGGVELKEINNTLTYQAINDIKRKLLSLGILHFDDAYFLAEDYLLNVPLVKEIMQKRFPFVFVDEMQDMDTHQYNMLEKIFYDEGNSLSKIQRIGDKNQAIYNSVKVETVWKDRSTVLRLSGSHRLSKPVADVVENFALHNDENFDIKGLNSSTIKPHILVFDNNSIKRIIPFFAEKVKFFHLNQSSLPIKVVCWNTDWNQGDESHLNFSKLRLVDYYDKYTREKAKPKQDYECLKSYLLFYKSNQTLAPIRKNILNAFVKILRIEGVKDDERYFTIKRLMNFIKDNNHQEYDNLNLKLYNWSTGVINGNIEDVWCEIKQYIPHFLNLFDKSISLSSDFINEENDTIQLGDRNDVSPSNYYREDGLEIEIASVHSVKGQTHCATLYLESFFGKGRTKRAKCYESCRLSQQFLGNRLETNAKEIVKQSAKMAYVGFSRPTDLLCIAIHKERFERFISEIDQEEWEVVDLTTRT